MLSAQIHVFVSDFVAAERVRSLLIPLGVRVEIASTAQSVLVKGENVPPDFDVDVVRHLAGVKEVVLTKRTRTGHIVEVGGVEFGGADPVVIAGPCAVESKARLETIALAVKSAGASMLRGGAFKPRTSPKSFQGLGEQGLKILREVGFGVGLPVVTEVPSSDAVALYSEYADMLQIGSRHMQNTPLLKAVGKTNRPVLLKRSATATLEEWVSAAEYIRDGGNERIVLCERGIRTFETDTRYTLDLAALVVVPEQTGLPVIADPSHAAGNSRWVAPLAKAALAAGAVGLMIEVHDDPASALSDGAQALTPEAFARLAQALGMHAKSLHSANLS